MTKIKSFLNNILTVIKNFFAMIGKYISEFFNKLGNTKAMKSVGNVLGYIPRKINARLRNDQRKAVWGIIFILPLVIGFIYFFFIPFILTFKYSFSYVDTFKVGANLKYTSIWIGTHNYIYIFKDFSITINYEKYLFLELLLKAFIEIITDLPIILIFSLIMAVVLNSKFKGRTFVRAIFFMPVIFNSQAIDLAVAASSSMSNIINNNTQQIFDNMFSFKDFLMNANIPTFAVTFLGDASSKIYDIISYSGIQILIFLSAIQSVPRHLYEAAKMEGATQYEMFWKITFPMVSPMLLTSAVYTIIDSYTRSPMIKALTKFADSGKSDVTLAPPITGKALDMINKLSGQNLEELRQLSNYGIGSALSLLYSLMVILIIVITLGVLSKAVFYYDN